MKNAFGRALKAVFGIKIRLWAFILACVLCVGVTYGLTVQRERNRIGSEDNYNQAMKYLEIKNVIDEYYVGTVDEEAVSASAFAAMVAGLGDEWSYYMSPSEYSAYQLYSANQYVGMGVSVDKDAATGGLKITGVYDASPADNAGLAIGDIILSINGEDITEPLDSSDTEISVVWNGTKDGKEYTFSDTLTLTMNDPHNAETLIFRSTGSDAVYMYGDGSFFACGVQAVDYKDYVAAKGYWSWDGEELCVVVTSTYGMMETYERTITVNGDADSGYSFTVYWGMFPMSITITKEQADIYLTPDTTFGDTSLTKEKNYPVWDNDKDIHETQTPAA